MNKNPIQSNLPEVVQKQMTSDRLYQHPVPAPKAHWFSNFSALLLLVVILSGLTVMFIYAADKEATYQVEAVVKVVGEKQ